MKEVTLGGNTSRGLRFSKGCLLGGGCALVVVVFVLVVISTYFYAYNTLNNLDQNVQQHWSQVENVLQRRADLLPQLAKVVKAYAAHERDIFEFAAKARAQALAARTLPEAARANNQVSQALSQLLAISENYPQLRASENFLSLQDAIEGSENRIAVERKRYNEAVEQYNRAAKALPMRWFVKWMGFDTQKEYFKAEKGATQVPDLGL